jgi:hypothetical protein
MQLDATGVQTMKEYQLRLQDDTCGTAIADALEIGDLVLVQLRDENGNALIKSGEIAEIFSEEEI